ncbi:aldehyde dehydrogenase [Paraburkholderia sp. BR14320]|uniref:aldehyde dehydrogenase n=1 Tax=unclassified Paraburkholderia TaxID=2615204 RepID=UPI0034CEDC26
MRAVQLLIAGCRQPAVAGMTFDRANPQSNQVVTRAASAGIEDARRAADAAQTAFADWSKTGPSIRRAVLLRAAELMKQKKDMFVETMQSETGATRIWAEHNVIAAVAILQEAASMTTQISGEVVPSDEGRLSFAVRQPAGVVLGIAPWNAPIVLGARAIAMPLACGNTVILKASEVCPATHALIGDVLVEAGLGNGEVNVILHTQEAAGEVVGTLIAHPAVRRINFTGSTRVGQLVAEQAARVLKPVLLELGGKSPLIVLDDADVERAVDAAAFGAFFNQGQICMSTERIVVTPGIAQDFVARLADKARRLTVGDPGAGQPPLGALASAGSGLRINELIDDALAQGATLLAGGKAKGVFMPATVLDGVTHDMSIYHEETFGPVVCVMRATDDDHAIEIANDTEFGLSAAVFSNSIERAFAVTKQIRSGICHINGATVSDEPQMPFGGTGRSGYGRFGGNAGIAEFTELRWITVASTAPCFPI